MEGRFTDLRERYSSARIAADGLVRSMYLGNKDAAGEIGKLVGADARTQKLIGLSAESLRDRKRYDGLDYFIHPVLAARIIHELGPSDADSRKAINYALAHDLVDEALDYDAKKLEALCQNQEWQEFKDELRAAVTLSGPNPLIFSTFLFDGGLSEYRKTKELNRITSLYGMARIATAHMIANSDSRKELALAFIAEKMDNQYSLGFLEGRPHHNNEMTISDIFVAFPLWALRFLEESVPGEMALLADEMSHRTIDDYKLDAGRIREGIALYQKISDKAKSVIENANKQHLKIFDTTRLIG